MGDLDIRSGGVVAVDTASLRAAADRLVGIGDGLDDVGDLFRRSLRAIELLPHAETVHALGRSQRAHDGAVRLADEARRIAERLVEMAAMYETVELWAERSAAEAAGDQAAVEQIDGHLARIAQAHPWAAMRAPWEEWARSIGWTGALVGQSAAAGWLTPAGALGAVVSLWGLAATIRGAGNGTIERGAVLAGPVPRVAVRELPATGGAVAPAGLAAVAQRIPTADASRIRVEQYAMRDGTRQYAVYVRGTTAGGDDEAFDMPANMQLYPGERSASYQAVVEALRQAGAEPGDVVHAFGHSQGGMIASRLAVEGGFDTQTLVTFGSPAEAQVGDDTLSVTVRHLDDPVAALAGGGFDAGSGSPGSFVAERTIDPAVTGADLDPLQAHHMEEYETTAAMLDASRDPRMDAVRDRLAELGTATSVTVSEYAVARVETDPGVPVCR